MLLFFFCSFAYPWLQQYNHDETIAQRIQVPEGFERMSAPETSFAYWLRNLPLKPDNPAVLLYDGTEKLYQEGHYAVINIDVGETDLQQCADAIIRLYAEYLYAKHDFEHIEFQLTNGDRVRFRTWMSGYRPTVKNNGIDWHKKAAPDSSYTTFRDYLAFVFTYAGTYSLSEQLHAVSDIADMHIGDIFVQAGFPGHAILVLDMAVHKTTNEKIFLVCQSYMPAQDIHILNNLNDPDLCPWFRLDFGDTLHTPEWNFTRDNLKRFPSLQ